VKREKQDDAGGSERFPFEERLEPRVLYSADAIAALAPLLDTEDSDEVARRIGATGATVIAIGANEDGQRFVSETFAASKDLAAVHLFVLG